jgi:hypothetical protein
MPFDPRFDFVHTTLYRCNQAISELYYISEVKPSVEEAAFASSHLFSIYSIALHYLFNAEYNKLLETKVQSKFPDNHIASIALLNRYLFEKEGDAFRLIFEHNEKEINKVRTTTFSEKQRLLRNKRFSHADLHEVNDPFKFPGMTDEDVTEAINHLRDLFSVVNRAAAYYDFSMEDTVPSRDDRTRNFIHFHTVYQKYYNANYLKAWEEGFRTR